MAILLSLALLAPGCAFLNRKNTPTLNFVQERMWPESKEKRILAAPVVYPVGLLAVAVDAAVIHPATVIDDAAKDAKDSCWDNMKWDKHYVRECGQLPWRAVFTPPVFGVCWLGRSLFNIEDKADESRSHDSVRAALDRAKSLLDQGDAPGAADAMKPVESDIWRMPEEERIEARGELFLIQLSVARKLARGYPALGYTNRDALKSESGEAIRSLFAELKASADPVERLNGIELLIGAAEDAAGRAPLLRDGLGDSDPIIRYNILGRIAWDTKMRPLILSDVEKIAASDKEPLIRAKAAEVAKGLKEARR